MLRFKCWMAALLLLAGCSKPRGASDATGEPARFPEHLARSVAALGHPGGRRAFQVGPGSVIANGEDALAWDIDGAGDDVVTSPVWFERDGVPVAHWEARRPGTLLRFEAAAIPVEGLGDSSGIVSVQVMATNTGDVEAEVGFVARIRVVATGTQARAWDARDGGMVPEAWRGREALRDGRVVARFDPACVPEAGAPVVAGSARAERDEPGTLAARCLARLDPGASRAWHFVMPLYPTDDRGALARAPGHADVIASARRHWRAVLGRAASFEGPDSTLDAAWRAALVTLVQCHERADGRWVPIGNPLQYRDVWLRDGARAIRALALAGLHDFAADDARSLAAFQLPIGVLLSQPVQLDVTCQALWAFEQASALGADVALARDLLPVADRALSWIERQRWATASLGLEWGGLMPFADPRDNELTRGELVGNDAWGIAGCDAVAALARRAGNDTLKTRAVRAAAAYRAAFAAALSRARHPDVPPSWRGPGRDWGNTSVGYPTRALPPGDARLRRLAIRVLAPAGTAGLATYGGPDSLHAYHGSDLAQWALHAGHPALARGWLAALLAHSSSTLGQAEISDRREGGFGTNLPPHATAAAAVVDLVRTMMVADLRDTLEIGLGADATWWEGTALERAPTRFGVTSVRLERPAANRLRVRVEPLDVPLEVRVPDGLRATRSRSPGTRVVAAGNRVEAPPGTREVEFEVAPAPGAAR